MIPIGDDNSDRRTTPVMTWFLMAANILVFIFFQGLGFDESAVASYAMVPGEIVTGHDVTGYGLGPTPVPVYLTILISMFMHGGFLHLAGNMLFLGIFGDNIEDALGHVRYLAFYLVGGALAGLAHVATAVFFDSGLLIPTLGASGAISAVMGAYLRLFPRNRVRVLMFDILPTTVPAVVMIGLWFLFQLVNGLGYLGSAGGGVAYAAHIGGFLFGLLFIRSWLPRFRR